MERYDYQIYSSGVLTKFVYILENNFIINRCIKRKGDFSAKMLFGPSRNGILD